MSDKEKYTCVECTIAGRETLVELDANGRCGVCHSDAVLSQHAIKDIVREAQAKAVEAKASFSTDQRSYYYFSLGAFETIVSYRDAADQDDAYTVAHRPIQPWYFNPRLNAEQASRRVLTHNEYCDWLRSH